jgi:hypothetical protein
MKKISEIEEKPSMSSLLFCCRKGWGWAELRLPPSPPPCFPADPWIFHLKDDVTVTLLIGISFTHTVGVILLILTKTKSPLFTEKHLVSMCLFCLGV